MHWHMLLAVVQNGASPKLGLKGLNLKSVKNSRATAAGRRQRAAPAPAPAPALRPMLLLSTEDGRRRPQHLQTAWRRHGPPLATILLL